MFSLPFDTNKLIEICRRNDIVKVGIFGSMARGEATVDSDIDLLVEFSKRICKVSTKRLFIKIR